MEGEEERDQRWMEAEEGGIGSRWRRGSGGLEIDGGEEMKDQDGGGEKEGSDVDREEKRVLHEDGGEEYRDQEGGAKGKKGV